MHIDNRRTFTAALASITSVLSGCLWAAPGAGPDRRAHNPLESEITAETVASLEVLWEAPTGAGIRQPVTSTAGVHVAAGKAMFAFDAEDGHQLWVRDDPNFPDFAFMGPPTVAHDLVWVSYGIGNLGGNYVTERVDPSTGEVVDAPSDERGIIDTVRGDEYLLSAPSFGTNTPIALSVKVGDLQDPAQGWTGTIDFQEGGGGWSPLTLGTQHAYQAGHGLIDVEAQTRGNGVRGFAISERPPCPPSYPETFACPTWLTALDGSRATSPVLSADTSTLFTGTDAGTIYAVDTSNGVITWSVSVGSAVGAEPALADGSLYVPTASGQLVVLDPADGTKLWEADGGNNLGVQPAVAADLVYTGATDGTVSAFPAAGCDAATCDALWSADAGAAISGAPAVSGGQLFVGAATTLVAFGLADGTAR